MRIDDGDLETGSFGSRGWRRVAASGQWPGEFGVSFLVFVCSLERSDSMHNEQEQPVHNEQEQPDYLAKMKQQFLTCQQ